jgi:hypothetical protein
MTKISAIGKEVGPSRLLWWRLSPPLPVRKISTEMKIIAVLEEKEG